MTHNLGCKKGEEEVNYKFESMKSDVESSVSTSTVVADLSLQSKDVQSLPQKQKIINL